MKIVATTQLVVQTMVGCWVLGVGCCVLVYIFYVENIIKKFIIFAQGYSYESGCGWSGGVWVLRQYVTQVKVTSVQ